MQKFRLLLTRAVRFSTAFVETTCVAVCSLAVYLLISNKDAWTDLKIIAIMIVGGLGIGATITRALAIIDHGWRGLFTTYKP